jgi:hypothetical protein
MYCSGLNRGVPYPVRVPSGLQEGVAVLGGIMDRLKLIVNEDFQILTRHLVENLSFESLTYFTLVLCKRVDNLESAGIPPVAALPKPVGR